MGERHEILDATCGGKSIWVPGNKDREDVLYVDKREEESGFIDWETENYGVEPDEVQDYRDLPYEDNKFNLVVFDPPHRVTSDGMEKLSGFITQKYGALHAETWQRDLEEGFEELWRVLDSEGVLIFKFADVSVDFDKVIDLAPTKPLFGTTTKKAKNAETRWFVFYKKEEASDSQGTREYDLRNNSKKSDEAADCREEVTSDDD